MTKEEAISKLKIEQDNGDTEVAHSNADQILCDLLIELGYGDVVDEWAKIGKWYA